MLIILLLYEMEDNVSENHLLERNIPDCVHSSFDMYT